MVFSDGESPPLLFALKLRCERVSTRKTTKFRVGLFVSLGWKKIHVSLSHNKKISNARRYPRVFINENVIIIISE